LYNILFLQTMKSKTLILLVIVLNHYLAVAQPLRNTVNGNNTFAFELLKNVFSTQKNTFISPYSISSALAMTYAGAKNETERQMNKVLHYNQKQANTHQGFFEINNELAKTASDSSVLKLSIANALWKSEKLELKKDFLNLTKQFYNASIFTLQGAKPINDWAFKNTNGKISEIVNEENIKNASLVLTNAIYFKVDWSSTFDAKDTKKEAFKSVDGTENDVEMMYQNNKSVNYYNDDNCQVLEMPYKGEKVSMYIILPNEKSNINELVKSIDNIQLSEYKNNLQKHEVKIFLPKFKFTSEFQLEKTLANMGMPDAFSAQADFSGMADGLNINEVIHKAFIAVNEKGSEAAAVTSVAVGRSIPEIFTFKANRPFLFVIGDKRTDSILFIGTVINPTLE